MNFQKLGKNSHSSINQQVPKITFKFVELTYKISKQGHLICESLAHIALMGFFVEECLTFAVKTGKSHLLKMLNEYFRNSQFFESIIVKTAHLQFRKLKSQKDIIDNKVSEETLKKLISPIIMVLVNKPELLEEILNEYFEICSDGAKYFENKLEMLLQQIVKSKEHVKRVFGFLLLKFKEDPSVVRVIGLIKRLSNVVKGHSSYYRTFIECLHEFYKNETQVFALLRPNLEIQVLFDFIILMYETNIDYFNQHLTQIWSDWAIRIEDFFKFTAFTEKQFKNFDLCAKFCNDLISWNASILNARSVFQYLYSEFRSNVLAGNFKEFPVMMAHIALMFARMDREKGSSIEVYLDIFREGINANQCSNPVFWNCLIGFCMLDKIIAEEAVRHLLPEGKQKEFIRAVRGQ